MPCDSRPLRKRGQRLRNGRLQEQDQTISERKEEIRRVIDTVEKFLIAGKVKVKIGPRGEIAFVGLPEDERNGVADACCYRRIMSTGSGLAKAAIQRAEAMAGRTVNKQLVGIGAHGHTDAQGNTVWHNHKG